MPPRHVPLKKNGHLWPDFVVSNPEIATSTSAGLLIYESEDDLSTTAYLSLGSNLGDRASNLRQGIARIGEIATVSRASSFYETEPMELRDQPWFLNCAVEVRTDKSAQELLAGTQKIEHDLGRNRAVHKGPRTLDIDLLLFGNEVIDAAGLVVPHPRMHLRRFVLAPLAELSANLRHPLLGKSMCELLADLGAGGGEVRQLFY